MGEFILQFSVGACTECVEWAYIHNSVDWLHVFINCSSVG